MSEADSHKSRSSETAYRGAGKPTWKLNHWLLSGSRRIAVVTAWTIGSSRRQSDKDDISTAFEPVSSRLS
ncbi:hypothetical protein VTK26DRAFT_2823 [Humicola hyalothermophila]